MKLNIYEKKKIVKTYTAETYDLMFGTVEDIAEAVNLDELKTGSDMEVLTLVGNFVMHSMGTVKELLKDIFDGLTDEELKNVKVSEIIQVVIDVVMFTMQELGKGNSKN